MRTVTLTLPLDTVVQVRDNHGGYLAGRCIACNESGWLEPRFGVPFGSEAQLNNHLHHKKDCPVGQLLTEKGFFKKKD